MTFTESLFADWKFKGHWWNAALTEKFDDRTRPKLSGELTYGGLHKGLELSLIGDVALFQYESIEDIETREKAVPGVHLMDFMTKEIAPPVVHGMTTSGMAVSLIDTNAFGGSRSSNSILAAETNLWARIAVTDLHVSENEHFQEMTLSFPGFSEFCMTESALPDAYKEDQSSVAVPMKHQEFIAKALVRGEQTNFCFWRKQSGSYDFYAPIETIGGVTITPESPQGLTWFMQTASSFQHLMSTLYGRPTCPDRMYIRSSSGEQGAVWFGFNRERIAQKISRLELLTEARLGTDLIGAAVTKWFELPADLADVINRFWSNFFSRPTDWSNLVSYAQILEVLHTPLSKVSSVLSVEQQKSLNRVCLWINESANCDKDLLVRINDCLAHVGKPNQKHRLGSIFDVLHDYLPELFFGDSSNFVKCVVETRHFYVHGTQPAKSTLLSGVKQATAVEGLKLATLLLCLKELGFDAASLAKGLDLNSTCVRWKGLRKRYLTDQMLQEMVTSPAKRTSKPKTVQEG